MEKKPNHQKVSDETYQERYFLFLREQLVRLDKEFKSSFEKTKELRKRYQEAINDKSFVGKELTELQRTYEALEEVTNLSREILRELKIKDRILSHDPETIYLDLRLIKKLFPDLQEEAFFEFIEKSGFFDFFRKKDIL